MKRPFVIAALYIFLAGGAAAQSTQTEVGRVEMSEASVLVGDLIGEPVYNFRGRPVADRPMPVSGAKRFKKIATIKDVMINTDGTVEAIVMDVSGFLGLGSRDVTAAMDGITVVTDVRGEKYFVVYTYEDTLNEAPEFNKTSRE